MLTIILVIVWASIIFQGIYGLVKGSFYHEQKDEAKKHEPNAYRKWVRISSVFITLCGIINVILSILDGFSGAHDFKYVIFIVITAAVVIAATAVAYACIVKPADKRFKSKKK